jgi:hypothetical protein
VGANAAVAVAVAEPDADAAPPVAALEQRDE